MWSPTGIDHRSLGRYSSCYSGSIRLVEPLGLFPHLYAEDTQIYGFCRPSATDRVTRPSRPSPTGCVSKTEVLWCGSVCRQSQLSSDPLAVGCDLLSPVSCVRDLGTYIDADLTMRMQVTRTCSKCFAALRQVEAYGGQCQKTVSYTHLTLPTNREV